MSCSIPTKSTVLWGCTAPCFSQSAREATTVTWSRGGESTASCNNTTVTSRFFALGFNCVPCRSTIGVGENVQHRLRRHLANPCWQPRVVDCRLHTLTNVRAVRTCNTLPLYCVNRHRTRAERLQGNGNIALGANSVPHQVYAPLPHVISNGRKRPSKDEDWAMLGQHVCPSQSRDAPIRPYFDRAQHERTVEWQLPIISQLRLATLSYRRSRPAFAPLRACRKMPRSRSIQ